tara:strand:+ start:108 stop:689 length:582 start_codon:yes stop_codon:yes gene_type:complete
MKLEIFFLAFLGIFLYDLYYDHFLLNFYKKYKKYGVFIFYTFIAFSFYLMFKKNPSHSYSFMQSIKNLIHYAPIDKDAKELFTPLFEIPNLSHLYKSNSPYDNIDPSMANTPQYKRMMNSGKNNRNKRCVSETKKKFIASSQDWKCNKCGMKLSASFEVDHKKDLQYGGTNHVDNLEALCRNCHGEKTAMNFL